MGRREVALPPEPLEDLLRVASLVVEAEVTAVLAVGEPVAEGDDPPGGWTGPVPPEPWQLVNLRVHHVLRGPDTAALRVRKPVAPYTLTATPPTRGIFLLALADGPDPIVLGRYGPESWPAEDVAASLGV